MRPIRLLAGLVPLICCGPLLAQDGGPKQLAEKAKAILKTACYRCHGENGAVEGGFNYVLDRTQMVSRRRIVPGDAGKSKLIKRIVDGDMPPENEKPRPSAEEIKILQDWITAGAPDFNPQSSKREFIKQTAVVAQIQRDMQQRPERERRFARYFTIAHLYNAGLSEDELETYRNALSKLINSLSWGNRVAPPTAIDAARTIFRIDLRDYKWTEKSWELLLARYPFGWVLGTAAERDCQQAAVSPLPYLRADWFVAAASHPPLYHDLLQLPDTDLALEKELRIDVAENIKGERLARAGFNSSGVSRNNRLVERHETAFGAYWKSYDFGGNSGKQNLFAQPLGPAQLISGGNTFEHDGGEIIFNLPNGLQAYMLVDAKGRRIDKGPTEIVSDPRRPDRAVVNGLSCMSCHARGMIPKEDQVRAHVEKNRQSFAAAELATILALYPPRDKLNGMLAEDSERFKKAVEKTGAKLSATEPIVALALRFEAEIDVQAAAAEVGLTPADFMKGLAGTPSLARTIGPLSVEGGTVQRQVFTQAFPDVIRDLRLGSMLNKDGTIDIPAVSAPGRSALPAETLALVRKVVRDGHLARTKLVGFTIGDPVDEVPADGGLLIGFEVGFGMFLKNEVIHSLRPIFWTAKGEVLGQVHGQPGHRTAIVKAKDGYAVGGIDINHALTIDSMRISFMRLRKDSLDPKDNYQSELVGGAGGRPGGTIGGNGELVVGIAGLTGHNQFKALGLVLRGDAKSASKPPVINKIKPPSLPNPAQAQPPPPNPPVVFGQNPGIQDVPPVTHQAAARIFYLLGAFGGLVLMIGGAVIALKCAGYF